MPRLLFSVLLMAAIILAGVLPRAAMVHSAAAAPVSCHQEVAGLHEQNGPASHCGLDGQPMSGACVIACVGSLADWPQPLDALPADFAVSALWFPSALVLRGRLTDPDDRPPRSI